jgi:hypothetical protein
LGCVDVPAGLGGQVAWACRGVRAGRGTDAPAGATPCGTMPPGVLSQVCGPLDDQAAALIAEVGYFRLGITSPTTPTLTIMGKRRDKPAWRRRWKSSAPKG